jgi:hypothetical protein
MKVAAERAAKDMAAKRREQAKREQAKGRAQAAMEELEEATRKAKRSGLKQGGR